jgi:16S rRNA processing protein RimM
MGRAHGLRGEIAVTLSSNQPRRLAPGSTVYTPDRELTIVASREHQSRWLVKFEGIDDRTTVETLLGVRLYAEALEAAPEGEVWVHELIASEVYDPNGERLGVVASVEANPAHDLLVLEDGTLVPMVFLVDRSAGRVVVDVPEGLLDINRRDES